MRSKKRGRAGRASGWVKPQAAQRWNQTVRPLYPCSPGSCSAKLAKSRGASCRRRNRAPPHTQHQRTGLKAGSMLAAPGGGLIVGATATSSERVPARGTEASGRGLDVGEDFPAHVFPGVTAEGRGQRGQGGAVGRRGFPT